MESKTIVNDLFILWRIKILVCLMLLLDLLSVYDFYNIMYLSFGKYWFPDLCRSSKCWYISFYNIKKSCIIFSLTRKVFKYWESLKFTSSRYKFARILFFSIWKLDFYHWQQTLCIIFLEVTDSHCLSWRPCLLNTHLSNHRLLVILLYISYIIYVCV